MMLPLAQAKQHVVIGDLEEMTSAEILRIPMPFAAVGIDREKHRCSESTDAIRWDEKAGLRRDAVGSQVIDVLEAQEIKETGNEEDQHRGSEAEQEYFGAEADDRFRFGRSIELVLRVG
jgi:hypothetical protein